MRFSKRMMVYLALVCVLFPGTLRSECTPYEASLLKRAYGFMQKKQYTHACSLLHAYVKSHKDMCEEILLYLGNAYLLNSQYKDAIVPLESFVKKRPRSFDGWNLLASAYYGAKRYMEARGAFLRAYRLSPSKVSCIYYAGICTYLAGRREEACSFIKRAISLSRPHVPYPWEETLISVLFSLKQYKEALVYVEELSTAPIKNRKRWEEIRLQLYLFLKMWARASSYAMQLLETRPLDKRLWDVLFQVEMHRKQLKDALCVLLIKGYISPPSAQEEKLIGDMYLQLNIPYKAVHYYEEAEQKAHYKDLPPLLARCYLRLDRPKKALVWVNRALVHKRTPALFALKGEILYRLNRFLEASTAFEKAAHLSPSSGRYYLFAGYCAFYAREWGRAKRLFIYASRDRRVKKQALSMLRQIPSH